MYDASAAFHEAAKGDAEQKAMLIFEDCVFTDEDISIDVGIEFNDYFNTERNICIGQANSNELKFTLFNDDRLLNDYEFGEFTALIGVQVGEDIYQQTGGVMVTTQFASYVGRDSYPFITRNGYALAGQPGFAVKSIASYEGSVYAFSDDGRYVAYNDATGENITWSTSLHPYMLKKSIKWSGKGIYYNKDSRVLFVYFGGRRKRYEFIPLGIFTAERPNAPDILQIDFTCYDRMQKFDEDMPTAEELGMTYPSTIFNLYEKLCQKAGVPYSKDAFINSTAQIKEEPADFEHVTMREVLKWIAEAAGSNIRFNRDGKLEMCWLRYTGEMLRPANYSSFNPYWYQTKAVEKLCNRSTQEAKDIEYGEGEETYLIQDNPLLSGVE